MKQALLGTMRTSAIRDSKCLMPFVLLTTKTTELIGFNWLGAVQSATMAVMSYSGYGIEDAIIMNQASLDPIWGFCNQELRVAAATCRPLLTTKTIELIGFDRLGAGQNATVAVMSYSGYDIEDAIIMNQASLDRGFGRCVVLRKYGTVLKKHQNRSQDTTEGPKLEAGQVSRRPLRMLS